MSNAPVVLLALTPAVETQLAKVLVQLIVVIVAARICAALFRMIGQPRVVGEIAAGLILGPSLLGWLMPDVSAMIFGVYSGPIPSWGAWIGLNEGFFRADVSGVFFLLAQIGLVFLLFLIGLEFDFSHLRRHRASAGLISVTGIALPFALGCVLAVWMHPTFAEAVPGRTGFALFMGTAMSITAIPILGRIMMELNLTRTKLGAITITAAAIDDAVGWVMLATVSALVQSSFSFWRSGRMAGLAVAYALFLLVIVRPWLRRWARRIAPTPDVHWGPNALAAVIILVLVSALITNLIGIFAIFGAFLMGAAFSGDENFRLACSRRLSQFVNAFFLPIFFTYTGLRTDIGSLDGSRLWVMAALVCLVAIVGKFVGCGLAARASGMNARESFAIGAMMNTRALMELIVINVGHDLGVIPKEVFCMLVIMALLTTVMATPCLLWTMRHDEAYRPLLAASPYARR